MSEEDDSVGADDFRPKDLVFVPLGLVATVKDTVAAVLGDGGVGGAVGSLARRGRAELDTRRAQLDTLVGLARSLGSRRATADAEDATESVTRTVVSRPAQEADDAAGGAADGTPALGAAVAGASGTAGGEEPSDAALAIADYDTLSATQIAQRLTGLQRDELVAVRAYEDAHRRRRTIIGRIDALVAAAED
jgi:hypothetical protein